MYGITSADNKLLMCRTSANSYTVVFKSWDRCRNVVLLENALEADILLQECIASTGDYSLRVYEFTREQEEELVIKKLRGY